MEGGIIEPPPGEGKFGPRRIQRVRRIGSN